MYNENWIEHSTRIEILNHSKRVKILHEVTLRCPLCFRKFCLMCYTSVPNSDEEIKEIVNHKRVELYHSHIMDCNGK